MSDKNKCPDCGNVVAGLEDGICAKCLMAMAMSTNILDDVPSDDSDSDSQPKVGQTFGPYAIISVLGKGGMGIVFEAEELESGRRVALKVLSQMLPNDERKQRFLREGRLAASINHPNSVYVYGATEIEGHPVIIMELVGGGTLEDKMKLKRFGVEDVVDAILQVIDGLEEAEKNGILHRDVKPSNCFINEDGAVKIGDFGLSISTLSNYNIRITETGVLMGTPAFSSPEQLRGDDLDCRADMYSIGVMMYYLLSEKLPYCENNLCKLISAVLEQDPVPIEKQNPNVPSGLARIIRRCMARNRHDRYPSYAALRKDLVRYSSRTDLPAPLGLRFLAYVVDNVLLSIIAGAISFARGGFTGWAAAGKSGTGSVERNVEFSTLGMAYSEAFWPLILGGILLVFSYYVFFEYRFGGTVGKLVFGLKIQDERGRTLGLGRIALRAFIFFAATLPSDFYPESALAWLFRLVAIPILLLTMRKHNGFACLHDLITGIRVVRTAKNVDRAPLPQAPGQSWESGGDWTLGPYSVISEIGRSGESTIYLGFDPVLVRNVWLRSFEGSAPPVQQTAKDQQRPGRLRWLAGRRSEEISWDAYEAPKGRPFSELVKEGCDWKDLRFWLQDIAHEWTASEATGGHPETWSIDRIWISGNNRAKVLDFPPPGKDEAAPVCETCADLIRQMECTARSGSRSAQIPPYPLYVKRQMESLSADENPSVVEAKLQSLDQFPARVTSSNRAFLMLLSIVPVLLLGCLFSFAVFFGWLVSKGYVDMAIFKAADEYKSALEVGGPREVIDAWERYLARRFAARPASTKMLKDKPATKSRVGRVVVSHDEGRSISIEELGTGVDFDSLLRKYPKVSDEELEEAAEVLTSHYGYDPRVQFQRKREFFQVLKYIILGFVITCIILTFLPSLICIALFGTSVTYRLGHMDFVDSCGNRVSRWRLCFRHILVWLPFLVASVFLCFFYSTGGIIIAASLGLAHIGFMIWSVLRPERAFQDMLAGTWLVPR